MKRIWGLVMGLAVAALNVWGAFPWEDFDDMPLGSIATQPGWESSYDDSPSYRAGTVTNGQPLSAPNAVSLTMTAFPLNGCRMVYTNFNVQPGSGQGPMVRGSVWVYRENREQRVSVFLGRGEGGLLMYEDSADHTIIYSNTLSGNHFDTGVLWTTGRYSQVVFHYDTRTNEVLIDYDGEQLVSDVHSDGPKLTNFNRFYVLRHSVSDAEGQVLVDNAHIEAFPTNVVGWWRFDEYEAGYAEDVLGGFRTRRTALVLATNGEAADRWVASGGDDVPDYGGRAGFFYTNLVIWRPVTLGSNWTLEAFIKRNSGSNNTEIISMGDYQFVSFPLTNSFISFYMVNDLTNMQLYSVLRDTLGANLSGDNYVRLGKLPSDPDWHHVALVKSGAVLNAYVDYTRTSSNLLMSSSDGAYQFGASEGVVWLGSSFSHGNAAMKGTVADEIRLTAAALPPSKFLHKSTPHIRAAMLRADGQWELSFESTFPLTYDVEATDSLGSWTDTTSFVVATGHISRVVIPTLPEGIAFRFRRDLRGN